METPVFRTCVEFRHKHRDDMHEVSVQTAQRARALGLARPGAVALDGTEVAANAALASNRTHRSLEEDVRRMLVEAEAEDAPEDARYGVERRGDEAPDGLGRRRSGVARSRSG